jgi:hypothetical protein
MKIAINAAELVATETMLVFPREETIPIPGSPKMSPEFLWSRSVRLDPVEVGLV